MTALQNLYSPQAMNRFKFVRSIKSKDHALYAEKIFSQISFTAEELMDLKSLHRYAKTLHRLDENSCNGWPQEKVEYRDGKMFRFSEENLEWRAKDERKEASINKKIKEIILRNSWNCTLQGDPRGWPMKLTIEGIDCSVLVNY